MPSDKLLKTVIIARSGIYQYRKEDLPSLGLNVNEAEELKAVYSVYRPALVLENDKDKFSMLPLTDGHPESLVDSDNFKKLAIGFTGENIILSWNKEQNEAVLKTRVALVDEKALDNYMSGIDEVSLGYIASFKFKKGATPSGEAYDIIMTKIERGNHLAMTPHARAGSVACILDSKGGANVVNPLKYATGLIYNLRKIVSGVKDSDMGKFRNDITELAKAKNNLSDEELIRKVDEVLSSINTLPESDDKELLKKFLNDFKLIKGEDDQVAILGAQKIADLFEKLDTKTMEDFNMPEPMNKSAAQAPGIGKENTKDAIALEYVAEELIRLATAIKEGAKGGQTQGLTEQPKNLPTGDEESKEDKKEEKKAAGDEEAKEDKKETKDKCSDEDKKEEKKEEKKENVKDSIASNQKQNDVYSNITMDSGIAGKQGLTDFFNSKIKGVR